VSLTRKIRSRILNVLLKPKTRALKRRWAEFRRRLLRKGHTVDVFLELDDPYSYLLGEYLPDFRARYAVELRVHLTQSLKDDFRPHAELLAEYAKGDCERLARELGLPYLDKGNAPPVEFRRALIDTLAGSEQSESFVEDVLQTLRLYWRGDAEAAARRVSGMLSDGRGTAMLKRKQAMLARFGHYNAATLYYGGEWYWGVDRLHFLAERLDALGLGRNPVANSRLASIQQIMQVSLPVSPPESARSLPPLEFFFSFRSPYSYLALRRTFKIADAFGLKITMRPVLPMVMRGLQVPRAKLLYIAGDAVREAERLRIPFGKFSDPTGAGVERCLAVYEYAKSEKKGHDFLLRAAEAIWAKGVDVATDPGLRSVTDSCGLFWPDVNAALAQDGWRQIAAENRESLMESGCWGVPTLRLGEYTIWGQDRLWLLVRHIEEQCDTGDGILV
jgi:2-hydroxychromene-2-carboxylate isomerase